LKLEAIEKENATLRHKLMIANFPTQQATECGRCGEYRHTPWKDEGYGYICAACMYTMYNTGANLKAPGNYKQQLEQLVTAIRGARAMEVPNDEDQA